MSYINQYGQTIGPIKINNIWLLNLIEDSVPKVRETQSYLCFTSNKSYPKSSLALLMARTPLIGTSFNDEGTLVTQAPGNAVATVEWVTAFAALAPGDRPGFDISNFVKKEEFLKLESHVNSLEKTIIAVQSHVSTNTYNIGLNTASINSLRNRMSELETKHNTLNQTVQSMLDHPFPDGMVLICGEVLK